mgnify:CR=1 FL=1
MMMYGGGARPAEAEAPASPEAIAVAYALGSPQFQKR